MTPTNNHLGGDSSVQIDNEESITEKRERVGDKYTFQANKSQLRCCCFCCCTSTELTEREQVTCISPTKTPNKTRPDHRTDCERRQPDDDMGRELCTYTRSEETPPQRDIQRANLSLSLVHCIVCSSLPCPVCLPHSLQNRRHPKSDRASERTNEPAF